MNDRVITIMKVASAGGYILDTISDFKNTGIFKQKFKQITNRFVKQLESLENDIVEGSSDEVRQQLVDCYTVFDNCMELGAKLDPAKSLEFDKEFQELVEKYKYTSTDL